MKRNLAEWLNWQEQLHLSEIDLGLGRIRQVAKNLGLLQVTFPIITVAGTNGKGSSVAFLEAILSAQGYQTGSYTSPHLIEYNERIKLNTHNCNDQQIIQAFEAIDQVRADVSLTYFEFGTLAALYIFNKNNVDVAILEVGLGGRLDAANLWNTSLAIITSIGIDHVDWLGDDREIIAIEKAGIMRPNTPVVCGDLDPPVAIAEQANKIRASLYQYKQDFSYCKIDDKSWAWKGFNKLSNNKIRTLLTLQKPSLAGEFQLNNAATVIAGLQTIQDLLPVSDDAIQQGLKKAHVAGRLQIINSQPRWLIDVAHNPHAAQQLALYLQNNSNQGKTIALFSMLKDKDIEQVVAIMDKQIDEWHIVELAGSRKTKISELKEQITLHSPHKTIIQHSDFLNACESLKSSSNLKDRVVAFGSFLVVSEVINAHHQVFGLDDRTN